MTGSGLGSLAELTLALASGGPRDARLKAGLAVVTRAVDASSAGLFVRDVAGLALRAACGLATEAPTTIERAAPFDEFTTCDPRHDAHGFALLCPIRRRDAPRAVLGLGPRDGGRTYDDEARGFLRGAVAAFAPVIENAVLEDELRSLQKKRTVDRLELHDLLEVSHALGGAADEQAVLAIVASTAMSHFLVSRCGVYLLDDSRSLALAHGRGLPSASRSERLAADLTAPALRALVEPRAVAELPAGPLRALLTSSRLVLAAPIGTPHGTEGVLAIGERASAAPFAEGDRVFAEGLGRLARGALENAGLRRVRAAKERQDRELQIAREIQGSLFPAAAPDLPGFELAGLSRPCHEVGGDSYDWIFTDHGRLGLVIADVSGKGTPASLLMASVHAFLRAVAGTAHPAALMQQLNAFLRARPRAGRYVTLFYAELDPIARRLSFVRAGHVPPYLLSPDGPIDRLEEGGPALGLLDDAVFETGERILEPGDVLALVTDGVTEACAPDGTEFGDERVCETLRRLAEEDAPGIVEGLVGAVGEWTAGAPLADDETLLVVRVR